MRKPKATLALKLDSHQWHAYGALGEIAMHEGDAVAARRNLEMAIKHDDTDDDSLLALRRTGVPTETLRRRS